MIKAREQIYRQQILDHYHNPCNQGSLDGADCSLKLDNPLCGDQMKVFIKLSKNKVKSIKFKAEGCAVSIAAMSMLSDKVKGQKVSAVLSMDQKDILKMLGVTLGATRMKCAMLGLRAVQECLK